VSLHYLEQVIVALHDASNGKSTHIPYRNSMLVSRQDSPARWERNCTSARASWSSCVHAQLARVYTMESDVSLSHLPLAQTSVLRDSLGGNCKTVRLLHRPEAELKLLRDLSVDFVRARARSQQLPCVSSGSLSSHFPPPR
jgi:hypothetical protein